MPDTTTIARPYAKAIFEHALAANQLGQWSSILNQLAITVLNDQVASFISNPASNEAQQTELMMTPFDNSSENNFQEVTNLIELLAQNKRLNLLPDIKILFEVFRADQEKTIDVKVLSYSKLSNSQQEQLKKILSERLKRQVTLDIKLDNSLLGGAIIQAGDLVIDGSVRGKLEKLGTGLVA